MKTCDNCIHCKVNMSKLTVRCLPGIDGDGNDKGHWLKHDGGEHIFALYPREIVLVNEPSASGRKSYWEEVKLEYRKVFGKAVSCEDFSEI